MKNRVHCFLLELFHGLLFVGKSDFSLEVENLIVFRWNPKWFSVRSGCGFSLEVKWLMRGRPLGSEIDFGLYIDFFLSTSV